MAKRITTELIDDLDGSKAGETVKFGHRGVEYEIDLGADNARRLDDALAPFVRRARATRKPGQRHRTVADRKRAAGVRAWAREHGIDVPDRGRVPARVVEQYQAAMG